MTSSTRTKRLNRKLFASVSCGLLVCCFSLLLIIERNYKVKEKEMESVPKSRLKKRHECYQRTINRFKNEIDIKYLEDVLEAERKPNAGEDIFFHETTCSKSGLVHLSSRQACAIESAAKLNPKREVFVLFTSPVGFRDSVLNIPSSIEALKAYPNIHLRNNNIMKYAEDTPLEKWLNNSTLFESMDLFELMSDILSYLTLFKFGGFFLHLDVIVQQNFDHLGNNFAGYDSDASIGCGVLFANDKLGRKIADHCIRFLMSHFNGTHFVDNGSSVITKTLERMCHTKNLNLMTREQCEGFQLYSKSTFYAIPGGYWKWFFDPVLTDHTLALTKNSSVIYIRSDLSKNTRVKIGAHTAYEVAAKTNCPKVYHSRINYEYF